MMRLKVFSVLVICFCATFLKAQHTIRGIVASQQDSALVKECTVYLNGKEVDITDEKGRFEFYDVPNGSHVIQAISADYGKYSKQTIEIAGRNVTVKILLDVRSNELDEVVISEKSVDFGFTHMNAVENMGIYEGKKSEVILPDKLIANTSTNNARQVYARVAGLNIWENDAAGLQLGIGGRGLDPNRTSNFNVRQNSYDISADALGYPESYYTPPVEGIERIEIVRGAASLQYGTQFGGMINFVMKKPVADKKLQLTARQTLGSYGFYNAFTSVGGTLGKLSYYTFFQYKKGDGWRSNSQFESRTLYSNLNYQFTKKTKLGFDFTHMDYLAQQPGGLTDRMFLRDPRQTNRERNWFKVNWNLFALHFNHKFNHRNEFNLRLFGLSAYRYTIGYRPNRVSMPDFGEERDLIKGDFTNWGTEARFLKHYSLFNRSAVLLLGARYYYGYNQNTQGLGAGSKGKDADFSYVRPELINYDYSFPNQNVSLFLENIFYVHDKVSITPGIRYEYIHTKAQGYVSSFLYDLAGNLISSRKTDEVRNNGRQFVLAGVGLSYKPISKLNLYSNLSQNYRSITFSDMRLTNYSFVIDPNMKDESGYSFDLGARSEKTRFYSFDISAFYLNYANRIGEVQFYDQFDRILRRRGNIGQAVIMGVESYVEADFFRLIRPKDERFSAVLFANAAFIQSEYRKSENKIVVGKEVEFVPKINTKSGIRLGYKELKASFQYTYLSDQYSDATNSISSGESATIGLIPAYAIMDVSVSYRFKWFKLEGSVNNLADAMYFTRRATGYPGPGILPSDGRTYYLTLQVKI
jgi:Fe(3+) dicitrate transport protein